MSEGTPKAIEPKGIVRNATKIGVQDGQAEDLINLRFMDGSWRASGNGRQIENMPTGTIYQQIYVHTNVYHHLLGVDNGTLYWLAEIDNDGVTFYPLDGTTDRSQWPEDKQDLPTEPVALTTVTGSMWITQAGHLLTIIDEADDFEHFVFKTSMKEYIEVNMDVNGKATNRSLYPFGQVHFNWYSSLDDVGERIPVRDQQSQPIDWAAAVDAIENAYWIRYSGLTIDDTDAKKEIAQSFLIKTLSAFNRMNKFTMPFLVCAAVKLYDGSYSLASSPCLVIPRENGLGDFFYEYKFNVPPGESSKSDDKFDKTFIPRTRESGKDQILFLRDGVLLERDRLIDVDISNNDDVSEVSIAIYDSERSGLRSYSVMRHHLPSFSFDCVIGSDLTISIDTSLLKKNKDIYSSLCIFVTPQVPIFETSAAACKKLKYIHESHGWGGTTVENNTYRPAFRERNEIIHDLIHSPFYLLREYNMNELTEIEDNPIINLSDPQYKGVVENIVQQRTLPTEAFSRTTYLPKVTYNYNNRLHIANYKSSAFFGYPIDLFHLHNHSVKIQEESYFKGVLPNLADNNDDYLQYPRANVAIKDADTLGDDGELIEAAAPYFLVRVTIDTAQGELIVTRYIPAYDTSTPEPGRADFIEDLNPLLTYPDSRAKKIEIYYVDHYLATATFGADAGYYIKRKVFDLKPHPYLNMAYYIDPDLKPIKLSDFDEWPLVQPL